MSTFKPAIAALVLVLVLAGCTSSDGDGPADGDSDVLIMATTTIWADVARNVACDGLAEVESVLPPLADPHDFEPSILDRARMDEADLIVANGLGLEERLEDTLTSVEADGTSVFRVGNYVTTLEFDAESFGGHSDDDHDEDEDEGDHHEDEDGDDHDEDEDEDDDHEDEDGDDHDEDEDDHGSEDPHVWLDPVRVAQAVEHLGEAMVSEAGLDADQVAACTDAYLAELSELHDDISSTLDQVPVAQRRLVTNHDAFGYFADRYGFEVIGTVIPSASTLAEPSLASLEALADLIDATGVTAIFAEELGHNSNDADALADRLEGVSVESLYTGALGPEGSGAETYLAMMRANATTIAAALGG